ncbi:hypothetical protein J0B03_05920 [Alkalibacter rhizosphaerae]|uniref:O-antigen ligase domain-containing protein n=1 Tax=Alkalibacter rhizosphaerae TaxID=2815577 RepID=A0A975AIY4_9FIRM|nr:hypothetical protein [Alkalibacter rhizosphaerae]QSX09593.1 hypothetical protein J0B03_05920 [Alkalibacter rhizosphaerae]
MNSGAGHKEKTQNDKDPNRKRTSAILIGLSLINVTLLSMGHATGNTVLVLLSILMFLWIVLMFPEEYFLPLMIFYLPWSSLLRTHPTTSSFHSIGLLLFLVLLLIRWLKEGGDLRKPYFALSILFLTYTMMVKFYNRLAINPQYIFFVAMILFVPIYLERVGEKLTFDRLLLFLTLGNLSACISSMVYLNNPGVQQFMDINEEMIVGLRWSAFYSDPNYFSAQMLVAIAGWLILILHANRRRMALLGILFVGGLLYFAVQAVSKAFLLSGILVLFFWGVHLLLGKKSVLYKFYILLLMGLAVFWVVKNNVFEEQIRFYLLRFGKVEDAVSLTTGRLGLWQVYWGYMLEHVDKLVVGIGLSQDQLQILLHTNNAHMTLIQTVYQVGIIGFALLLAWWKSIYGAFAEKSSIGLSNWGAMAIFAVAVIMPWFGLDVLFFREFFYFPIMWMLLKRYLWERSLEEGVVYHERNARIGDPQKNQA